MKAKIKIDWVGFVSNMLAVILGIVITFGVQAIIDGKNQKREIASALQLVHDELAESLSSLQQCAQILDNESVSAQFFLTNRNRLADLERGILSMTDVVTSEDGMYILNTMTRPASPTINAGIPDIEKAIRMIGDYLCD